MSSKDEFIKDATYAHGNDEQWHNTLDLRDEKLVREVFREMFYEEMKKFFAADVVEKAKNAK